MPAGCEFICRNKDCGQFNHGFSMTAPWPMGQIELVVNSIPVKKNKELRDHIIEEKNTNNKKFFVIQFPNEEKIPTRAFRVSFWSPEAKCIWNYEIELNDDNRDDDISLLIEEAIKIGNIPPKCEKTGGDLSNFNQAFADGIECPFCNQKMQQSRWFSNE